MCAFCLLLRIYFLLFHTLDASLRLSVVRRSSCSDQKTFRSAARHAAPIAQHTCTACDARVQRSKQQQQTANSNQTIKQSTLCSVRALRSHKHTQTQTMTTTTALARKQANLKLLQRTCCPTIVDILVTATHVVLYEYRSSWHKTTQEGTLFVVVKESQNNSNSNSSNNNVELILLNRHSTDNFQVPITADLQVQQQEPFLMFKHDHKVWGIWFHSSEERQQVFTVLQQQQMTQSGLVVVVHDDDDSGVANSAATPAAAATTTTTVAVATTTTTTTTAPVVATPAPAAVALDKKALQLALLSLMQDERFLTLLHQQYIKVIRSKQQQNSQSGE